MSADTAAPPSGPGGTAPVEDPTDLTWPDYKRALVATKDEIKRDDVPSMAAGVAFKIFLALFPSIIAAVAIFAFFADPEQLDRYVAMLEGLVPEDALGLIADGLDNILSTESGQAGALGLAGIAGGLWAASSAAATLVKALNRAYETDENRGFFSQRGVALAITFALLVAILALVVLVIAGPQVQDLVVPDAMQGSFANIAFGMAQVLLALAVLALLFAFVYWIGPNRQLPKWQWMTPGALFGVVGWLLASLAFTLYVQNFGNYDNGTYAGLGSVIVLMLWLQISMMVLLIGGEFNAEVERLKAQAGDLSAGVGMGHAEGPPDAEASQPLPAPVMPPVPGAPLDPAAQQGRRPGAAPAPTPAPGPVLERVPDRVPGGPPPGGPPARAQRDPRAGPSAPPPRGVLRTEARAGSRALLAGAAAAAAALAAVVSIARHRD